jgi:Glu-tRNA(Gln) amidotransferase subunit E-like FAD-binding protein
MSKPTTMDLYNAQRNQFINTNIPYLLVQVAFDYLKTTAEVIKHFEREDMQRFMVDYSLDSHFAKAFIDHKLPEKMIEVLLKKYEGDIEQVKTYLKGPMKQWIVKYNLGKAFADALKTIAA